MDDDALFVYGTLMPGHLRWSMLAAHAVDQWPASVPGVLYDTGDGWPAARFATIDQEGAEEAGSSGTPGTIPGWVVMVRGSDLGELLAELDHMEGIGPEADPRSDPYTRIRVAVGGSTEASTEAWAYHATSVGRSWTRIAAWDGQAEA